MHTAIAFNVQVPLAKSQLRIKLAKTTLAQHAPKKEKKNTA